MFALNDWRMILTWIRLLHYAAALTLVLLWTIWVRRVEIGRCLTAASKSKR